MQLTRCHQAVDEPPRGCVVRRTMRRAAEPLRTTASVARSKRSAAPDARRRGSFYRTHPHVSISALQDALDRFLNFTIGKPLFWALSQAPSATITLALVRAEHVPQAGRNRSKRWDGRQDFAAALAATLSMSIMWGVPLSKRGNPLTGMGTHTHAHPLSYKSTICRPARRRDARSTTQRDGTTLCMFGSHEFPGR